MIKLDVIDLRILGILQRNNQLTNLELAQKVRLSSPTCLRRVRRLRQEKIIIADVSILDPDKVDQGMFVFVQVTLERQSEDLQRQFEQKMNQTSEVTQCYVVSGDTDFLL